MAKKIISVLFFVTYIVVNFYAADPKQNPEVKFIKGNIQDKIASIKEDDKEKTYGIAQKAVDFVIENITILKDDRDLAGLAIAGILAYPESEFEKDVQTALNKFGAIFYKFKDENVKISILDKLSFFSKTNVKSETVNFINNYLWSAANDKETLTEVEKRSIQILGQIGNTESFKIIYDILKNNSFKNIQEEAKNALVLLADKSLNELISIVNQANFDEMKLIFTLFVENNKISLSFKSEIAEKLLTNCMILVRDSSLNMQEISDFQLLNCRVLYENDWTRSSNLMISFFYIAKNEYKSGFFTDENFAKIISYVEKIASKDSVKVFSEYLGELNKEMENGTLPAEKIVSAVIQALGALGDKSAFDVLLYTTYLDYPEEIVAQARSALSSLKW